MITYKNIGQSTKTFYGVTFKPGDIKEVPGYINGQGMARIFNSTEIALSKISKKRTYTKKSAPVESRSVDSTSTTSNNENNIKEETPNGEH